MMPMPKTQVARRTCGGAASGEASGCATVVATGVGGGVVGKVFWVFTGGGTDLRECFFAIVFLTVLCD